MTTIRPAAFPADQDAVLAIWREFIAASPVNLDYQNNDAEFAGLPGKYAAPAGGVLLAESADGALLGCVAYRRVTDAICEMKRLYVRPAARGTGLGRALAMQMMAAARAAGYQEVRLDVHGAFLAARGLYAALGFVPAEPVSHNPVPGAVFLGGML